MCRIDRIKEQYEQILRNTDGGNLPGASLVSIMGSPAVMRTDKKDENDLAGALINRWSLWFMSLWLIKLEHKFHKN